MKNENIQTIPNDTNLDTVTYTPKFSAICSVGLSPFWGDLEIVYKPKKLLLEFESFEDWLREESNKRVTIEGFCQFVFDNLVNVLDCELLTVTVKAYTIVHAPVIVTIKTKG